MTATAIFVENALDIPVHVLGRVLKDEFHIEVHRLPGLRRQAVGPGETISFPATDRVAGCIKDGRLRYVVHNRTGSAITWDGGRERCAAGPILRVLPVEH